MKLWMKSKAETSTIGRTFNDVDEVAQEEDLNGIPCMNRSWKGNYEIWFVGLASDMRVQNDEWKLKETLRRLSRWNAFDCYLLLLFETAGRQNYFPSYHRLLSLLGGFAVLLCCSLFNNSKECFIERRLQLIVMASRMTSKVFIKCPNIRLFVCGAWDFA